MAIRINDSTYIKAGKAPEPKSFKEDGTPYSSVAEANGRIPIAERYLTLPMFIGSSEYWYRDGVLDEDLIPRYTPLELEVTYTDVLQISSALTAQEPVGLNTPISINFGATTAGQGVNYDGTTNEFTCTQSGFYDFWLEAEFGRTTAAGEAYLVAYQEIFVSGVWVSVGTPTYAKLDDNNQTIPYREQQKSYLEVGQKIRFRLLKDSQGIDNGGLYSFNPTISSPNIANAPSAQITIKKAEIQVNGSALPIVYSGVPEVSATGLSYVRSNGVWIEGVPKVTFDNAFNALNNELANKVDLLSTENQTIVQQVGTYLKVINGNAEIEIGDEGFSYSFYLAPNLVNVIFNSTGLHYLVSNDDGVTFKEMSFTTDGVVLTNSNLTIENISTVGSITVEKILIRDNDGLIKEIDKNDLGLGGPGGGIPEAPTTASAVYARSGENEDWVEAVPVTLTKDVTIDLGDFNLNETKTTTNYTYQEWKYDSGIERRITENTTQTKVVEEIAYNYKRDYVSYNDGVDQFDNYRQIEQAKIEDTVIVNDEDFYRSRIDDTGIELSVAKTTPSIFKRIKVALSGIFLSNLFIEGTPTENSNPTGKKLLVRDAITGEIQSIDVTNLGLGNPLFKGVFVSLVALQTAYPTGTSGDYAYVDAGVGQNIVTYVWDNNDSSWVLQSGGGGGISEAPNDGFPYVRQSLAWVQGVLKSTYDAFVSATNSTLSTITTKLNKYPSTATAGKILQGNGSNYVEVDEQNIVDENIFYDKSYWADATDFDTNAALSFSNGKLSSGSSSTSFATYLYPKLNISNSERVAFSATAKVPTSITAASYGYSVGRKTVNTWYTTPNIYIQIDFYTSQLRIWQNTTKLKEINAQTVLANHILELIYIQDGNYIKGILINHTTQAKDEISVWGNLGATKNLMVPNSSRLGVFFNQANFDVLRIQELNYEAKNAHITFLGDSKTFGYSSGDISLRFANLCASLGITRVSAGDGDRTVELIQALPRVLDKKSNYFVLCIGRNDLASGVLTATWQANYISIVNQIEATGAIVIHLIGIGETVQNQTALINFVESTYDSSKIINVSAGWVSGTMLSADNIHPNEVGMMYVAKQIKDSGKITQGYLTPPNLNRFNEFPQALSTKLDLYEAGGMPLHISTSNADSGAWLGSIAADNVVLTAGKKWNGSSYTNKATTNGGVYFAAGSWNWDIDTGSTVGGNSAGTTRATLNTTSYLFKGIDLRFENANRGIYFKNGTGQQAGSATLVSGTVVITNITVSVNSIIQLTYKTASGTLGYLQATLSSGSFTINSLDSAGALNTADNSIVYYTIVHNY